MKESLSSEHGAELVSDSFEEFLNRSVVSDERDAHLRTFSWNVT